MPVAKDLNAERIKAWNDLLVSNRIYGFCKPRDARFPEQREPNPLQRRLLDAWNDPRYKVFTYTGGNRIGKTTLLAIITFATMFGEWPWNGQKLWFPHTRPRKVRLIGSAWESHIKAVLVPKLEEWWPKSRALDKKKNNQGVDYFWLDKKTKSTLEILSNVQDSKVAEGWDGDLVGYDEPPDRDMRVACARGLIDRQGRELFTMTLISEAWVHREVIKARLPDGSPDMTVFNVSGEIYDNVGYGLTIEGVNQFEKTLKPEEKEARLKGKPSYLSTLVCPDFDTQTHVKERHKIPLDSLIDIEIDFHPSKPWVAVFMATARNNFKTICDEIVFKGTPKAFAEEIVRKIRERQYARVNRVRIDPLAKSGEDNDIDVYSIVSDTLAAYNIPLETSSKDKDNGIAMLNNLLLTDNHIPGLFFFKDCVKTIDQTEAWMYDPDTLKPSKKDDDAVECLYRLCLADTQWYPEFNPNTNKSTSVIL